MALQPGDRFGRYELVSWLGRGGMAETWRARWVGDAGVTKSVLIKKVLPEFADDDAFISMFISEARISATLSHGNIAQVFDFGRVDGQYYLAMELVDGQPLHRVLKRAQTTGLTTLPIPLAVYIVLEMCRGLHYAHAKTDDKGMPLSIVHRDISPDNVLISYEGQVKIVDFGIAKARMLRSFSTEPGVVKGKFLYFSPEQARGKEVDGRTDVWATGLVLYELLCGQRPVEGSQAAVMMRLAHGEFPSPREVRREIPSSLNEIVMRALSVDLAGRFESANAFGDALAAFLYSFAPRFSPMNLAYLVRVLFRGDMAVDGRELAVPPSFLEELSAWRTGTGVVQALKSPAPRKLLPSNTESETEDGAPTTPIPVQRAKPRVSTARESAISEVALESAEQGESAGGKTRWLLGAGLGGVALLAVAFASWGPEPEVPLNRYVEKPLGGATGTVAKQDVPPPVDPRPLSLDERGAKAEERLRQARVQYVERDYQAAHASAERCLDIEPDNSTCLLLSSVSLVRMGRADDGSGRFSRFLAVPRNPAHEDLTVLLIDDYRRAASAKLRNMNVETPPERTVGKESPSRESVIGPATASNLSLPVQDRLNGLKLALRENRYAHAVQFGRQCIELDPTVAECHMYLGSALARSDQISQAVIHYQQFLKLAPSHPAADRVRKLVDDYTKFHTR
ncbi:serine/threonine-protein kinase [Myxococcus sp. K15C18031901]|uniref:serine/threonine-protein kinase n=1 Tax=Myxococcus dinghuensis TaxID=2906761 RepID=UPI0020A751A4|nr:serine/threonine-protein kinase [Myxococcus dinghuensis]MCP3099411.1 serine/threonine-protein kinase [Myxococcus dinghuensis]